MQHYLPSGYAPIDRSQLYSRQGPRDDMRAPGRLLLIVPGVPASAAATLFDASSSSTRVAIRAMGVALDASCASGRLCAR